MAKITVLGAGTWGIALARLLANKNHQVVVWSALPGELESLSTTRQHPNLPGMMLPDSMEYCVDLEQALAGSDLVLFAVPSVFVRSTAEKAKPYITGNQIIVDVAKGVETPSLLTMSGILRDVLGDIPKGIVALSGPTHAEEVSLDLPTAIVAACQDEVIARQVQDIFSTPSFRVYTNTDVIGVEIGGAMKNIMALCVGIARGLGYGDNARAALITRGNAEICRLGMAMGGEMSTFMGLAGLGDLVVTCTSLHSRNLRAGMLIGQGKTKQQAREEVGMVVEGLNALDAAVLLAKKYDVEMPIVITADAVINHGFNPADAVGFLMGRQQKAE